MSEFGTHVHVGLIYCVIVSFSVDSKRQQVKVFRIIGRDITFLE